MNPINRAWQWLNGAPRHLIGTRILQASIGAFLCFRVATEFRFAPFLWGPNGVGDGDETNALGSHLSRLLFTVFRTDLRLQMLLAVLWAAGLCLLLGKITRAATLAALVITLLLEGRLSSILDGGDNITRIVLCYGLFLLPPSDGRRPAAKLASFMHNVAVTAIVAQVCILYSTAGLMKANGDRWVHGTALYAVSQIEWFSLPSSRWIFRNPIITTVACYTTIYYQLWFPVAIFTKMRPFWVMVGMSFHIGIAYTMGLIPFSTIMIGLELFLLSDDDYAVIRDNFRRMVAHWSQRKLAPSGA